MCVALFSCNSTSAESVVFGQAMQTKKHFWSCWCCVVQCAAYMYTAASVSFAKAFNPLVRGMPLEVAICRSVNNVIHICVGRSRWSAYSNNRPPNPNMAVCNSARVSPVARDAVRKCMTCNVFAGLACN